MPGSQKYSLNSHRKPHANLLRVLSLGLHEVFCGNSVNISDCRASRFSLFEAVTGSLITNYFVVCTSSKNTSTTTGQRSVRYAQVRIFRQLENQHSFWNRLTFLNKHLILSRSVKKPFSRNSVKISDCRVFIKVDLLKTLPGCRAYIHSVTRYFFSFFP